MNNAAKAKHGYTINITILQGDKIFRRKNGIFYPGFLHNCNDLNSQSQSFFPSLKTTKAESEEIRRRILKYKEDDRFQNEGVQVAGNENNHVVLNEYFAIWKENQVRNENTLNVVNKDLVIWKEHEDDRVVNTSPRIDHNYEDDISFDYEPIQDFVEPKLSSVDTHIQELLKNERRNQRVLEQLQNEQANLNSADVDILSARVLDGVKKMIKKKQTNAKGEGTMNVEDISDPNTVLEKADDSKSANSSKRKSTLNQDKTRPKKQKGAPTKVKITDVKTKKCNVSKGNQQKNNDKKTARKQRVKLNDRKCPHSSLHASRNYPKTLHLMKPEDDRRYLNEGNYLHGSKCQICGKRFVNKKWNACNKYEVTIDCKHNGYKCEHQSRHKCTIVWCHGCHTNLQINK